MLPFAGNALPFFSYGGSNLVLTLGAMGILLNVSRRREDRGGSETEHEAVNLRWRDGGRNLSRPRDGAGAPPIGA
jgi:cell division protein FtsW